MDKQNMVYAHDGKLFNMKREYNLTHPTRTRFENMVLSEIS